MTIEDSFYLLGIIYFSLGLLSIIAVLILGFFLYRKISKLKSDIENSAAVIGVTKIASAFSHPKMLSFLPIAPMLLSGFKLIQHLRKHSTKHTS